MGDLVAKAVEGFLKPMSDWLFKQNPAFTLMALMIFFCMAASWFGLPVIISEVKDYTERQNAIQVKTAETLAKAQLEASDKLATSLKESNDKHDLTIERITDKHDARAEKVHEGFFNQLESIRSAVQTIRDSKTNDKGSYLDDLENEAKAIASGVVPPVIIPGTEAPVVPVPSSSTP